MHLHNPALTRNGIRDDAGGTIRPEPSSSHIQGRPCCWNWNSCSGNDGMQRRRRFWSLTRRKVCRSNSWKRSACFRNIETDNHKLLSLIIAGQPELADRLMDRALRQLKQRIALRCDLRPLNSDESARYIAGRIVAAGGTPAEIFSREAVVLIHERSGGVPRAINVIADNALLNGYAAEQRFVTTPLVQEVCRDFDIRSSAGQGADGPPKKPQRSATALTKSDEQVLDTVTLPAFRTDGDKVSKWAGPA